MESLIFGAVLLNFYAATLIVARAVFFRTKLYRPMLWNILLSILPLAILLVGVLLWGILMATAGTAVAIIFASLVFLAWILMLPNASYLITELNLSHRIEGEDVPLWFDIILVISLAMSGVTNTVLNVLVAHFGYAIVRFGDSAAALFKPEVIVAVLVVMLMLGFGMYLGRYLRLNSWDVLHPSSMVKKVVGHFSVAKQTIAALVFTFTYAIFLFIIYILMAGPVLQSLLFIERLRG